MQVTPISKTQYKMSSQCYDFISLFFALIGSLASIASVIVAVVIYRHIPERDILSHRQRIREILQNLKSEMEKGVRNHMIRVVDINRFDKYYPEIFEDNPVQTYLKGELDSIDIKGVWIIDGLLGVEKKKGKYYVSKKGDIAVERLGLIPYSWIVDIDLKGDEIDSSVIIYCKFNKHYPLTFKRYYLAKSGLPLKIHWGFVKRRSPYQRFAYYIIPKDKSIPTQEIIVNRDNPAYP